MPGVDGESRFSINLLGIRGPELLPRESAHRILCVGGSTTECLYLDDTEAWPHVLMEELNQRLNDKNVWVGNAGISGYSTVRHLRFIEENGLWKQMDSVVFLVGANDLQGFLRYGLAMRSLADEFEERESASISIQPVWKNSNVSEMTRYIYREWSRPRRLDEDVTGLNYVAQRALRKNGSVRALMPDLSAAIDQYEQRIARTIDRCKSAKVRPVFLMQPSLLTENTPADVRTLFWSGDDGHGRYYKVENLGTGLRQYNQRLADVCAREHVECIDLTSMNAHPEFFYDEYHFNEAGAREVARLVAAGLSGYLEENGGKPVLSQSDL